MKQPAVFLDRDGVINFDSGYVKNPEETFLIEGVADFIDSLKNDLGFKAIVISNQSGVARGLMTLEEVESVNNKINELLNPNAKIDAFYFCTHHPDFDGYVCDCRKPSPFLILKAAKEHNLDLKRSYFIGDKATDMECGFNAGIAPILFNEFEGAEFIALKKGNKIPKFTSIDFSKILQFIINDKY